jgi:hypothetical protein
VISQVLAALQAVMAEAAIRWYLFGAQAGILYGVPRLTADVDATAAFPLDRAGALVELLTRGGFRVRVADIETFVRRTHVIPLAHPASGIPVDLVLAASALEEEFLDRAEVMEIGGVAVPVIAADDLIVTKVLAGRAKDMEDVQAVLREQRTRLDVGRIRRLLGDLDAALDRGDLLAAFESALGEVGGPGEVAGP